MDTVRKKIYKQEEKGNEKMKFEVEILAAFMWVLAEHVVV